MGLQEGQLMYNTWLSGQEVAWNLPTLCIITNLLSRRLVGLLLLEPEKKFIRVQAHIW